MVAAVGEHQVVEDAAGGVGEQAIALPPFGQVRHVGGDQRFQRQRRIGQIARQRRDQNLPHVADIEQPGRGAAVQVFLHHAHRVLHRHVVAGKRCHPGVEFAVKGKERRLLQVGHAASVAVLPEFPRPAGIRSGGRSRR